MDLAGVRGGAREPAQPDFGALLAPRRLHLREVRQRRWRALIVTAAVIGVLNALAQGEPTPVERMLASAIVAMAAVIITGWWGGSGWANPFLGLFVGIYAVYYALPVFLLEVYTRASYVRDAIPDHHVEEALALAAAGLAVCLGGCWVAHLPTVRRHLPALRMDWVRPKRVRALGLTFAIAGIGVYYWQGSTIVPTIAQQLLHYGADLSILGILMLFALQLRGDLGRASCLVLWLGLVPARVLLGFGTGATAHGIGVGLSLLVLYSLARRKVPWRSAILTLVVLILLLPVRQDFRARTWSGEAAERSLIEKAALYPLVLGEFYGQVDLAEAFEISLSRLSHLMTFAEVVEKTPGEVPYWSGETYYALLFKAIPRLLYVDKPTIETGQWFGHRYGFLSPDDLSTSYNLPQLIELYANFGARGVILGMFGLGFLYALVVRLFVHEQAGLGALVGGSYVLAKLLLIESSAALVFGGLFWNLVLVAAVHRLMLIRGTR